MMQELAAFAVQVMAIGFLTAIVEHLLPAGRIKSAAMTAIGFIYIAAVFTRMLGIIHRMGV